MSQTIHEISVIICAYTEERWDDLVAAVESVHQQTLSASEVIVVIDHNPQLMKRAQEHIQDVIVIENTEAGGLSGGRNSGIVASRSQIITFLDDDAIATPNWLKCLNEAFADSDLLGIGGSIIPLWLNNEPPWFPEEFYWVVGCTYRGMPEIASTIRNPIGANMSFRREVFDAVGGFQGSIGRIGAYPLGCEETELCIRASQYWSRRGFLYQPHASVFHRVPGDRTSWSYFCSRCYSEGISKAIVTKYVGVKDGLSSERDYVFRTLPQGVLHGLTDAFIHHDLSGLARAGAIITGLAVTTTGYLVRSICLLVSRSKKDINTNVVFSVALTNNNLSRPERDAEMLHYFEKDQA